jgi:radical SAM superfamily enzyme YgiQ (UPF0313 family)
VAANLLERFPAVDAVVRGEGEETLEEMLAQPDRLEEVAGLVYRKGNEIRQTAPRRRIPNLDLLPMPVYDAVDMSRYAVATIITSRGCPFGCSFCEVPGLWGSRAVTWRSLDRVLDEIRILYHKWGKRQINICDDTFVANRNRVLDFCGRLDAEAIDVHWECFARVDLMDEALMQRMAESGCTAVFFGIESGSDAVLDSIDKRFSVARARQTVSQAVKIFRHVYTSFIWGLPGETMEDFLDSVMLMTEFAQMGARVQRPYLSLRPGSALYQDHTSEMVFSEDLPLHFLEVPQQYLPRRVVDLVRTYPEIFPGFYAIGGPGFEEKRRFMARLETLGRDCWDAFGEFVGKAVDQATGAHSQGVSSARLAETGGTD